MGNLFRCVTCGKTITSEESDRHSCQAPIIRYKTIEASSYFTVKNEDDEECIVIDAFNGTGYTFVIKEPNLMPLSDNQEETNRQLTERNTNHEDNSTLCLNISSLCCHILIQKLVKT
jgi:hypothetical protein